MIAIKYLRNEIIDYREIYMVLYERKNNIQLKGGIIMLNLITILLGAAYITMNVIDARGLR